MRASHAVLGVCTVAYAVSGWLLLRPRAFWSPDQAVRFVQVEVLARNGQVSVPYPAAVIDPEGRFFPAGSWFHFERGGKHHLSYLPYFAALTAPLYAAFGWTGLVVLPGLAALASVAVTLRFLDDRAPGTSVLGGLGLGLGSPLVLYAASFWDHALVVALAAAACTLLIRGLERPSPRTLGLAGFLVGLGFWLRNEMYVLAAAVLVGWLFLGAPRVWGAFTLGTGMIAAGVPLWAWNTSLFGHPLGYKGASLAASRAEAVATAVGGGWEWGMQRLLVAYYQLVNTDFYGLTWRHLQTSLGATAAFLGAAFLLGLGVRRRSERLVALGGLLAVASILLVAARRSAVSGLLPAFPALLLAFLPGRRERWEGFLWVTCLVFTVGVVVTGTRGGVQWGPRYLLPVLPALTWLAFACVDRCRISRPEVWPAVRGISAALVGAGVLVQASGVDQLEQWTARNRAGMEGLRGAPAEVVVTSFEWIALLAGPVYFEKQLMLVQTPEDLRALVHRFAALQIPRWTYVPASGARFTPRSVIGWSAEAGWPYRVAEDRFDPGSGLRLVTFEGGR
ncbi:MAG: hypothetical protein QN172_06635 [Armatimonadota bacterium]|nr:hypothetical protein [Armatimonadota bacterium]MDR7439547.1 hypothetical protein [Armatimonadota bacterium]MDR7443217.1 hypothetical protein [Armatimonadota bacterium]MDR7563720.1 hypothetical protein [Armatimonadota bacterium]MDR7602118.1 hypothetical protein [Armatimonadota bacterium]